MVSETAPDNPVRAADPRRDKAASKPPAGPRSGDSGDGPILELTGISKAYGVTQALSDVNLVIQPGEIIGLVGHNGAGKSTLMRVIVGLTKPDAGSITMAGAEVGRGYSLQESRARGVRIAYQELSLAQDLKAFENVLISAPSIAGWRWRRRSQKLLREALNEIFPGNKVPVRQQIRILPLAQQQMLEVAQAMMQVAGGYSLLILDEPTSALAGEQADNLFRYLKRLKGSGISTVLITHKLHEVLGHTDRVVVMRDGRIVSQEATTDLDHDRIVTVMGGVARAAVTSRAPSAAARAAEDVLSVRDARDQWLQDVSLTVRAGEIVGLSGLDGQGQQQLLRYLWRNRSGKHSVRVTGGVSFITGDRQASGVFPLWSTGQNIGVGVLRETSRHGVIQRGREQQVIDGWLKRLAVRGTADTPVSDLSGGNQQKALIARALASRSRVVLLDDPFRGVDIETKQQAYQLMREEAAKSRGFLWFTTENAELAECDRVYVMAAGRIAVELSSDEISEESIIAASFERN